MGNDIRTFALGTLAFTAVGLGLAAFGQAAQPSGTAEAQGYATRVWDSILTKCGDSYYYRGYSSVTQYRQVSFRVLPRWLSDADRMNGKTWEGEAVMSAHLRRWTHREGTTYGKWFDWEEGAVFMNRQDHDNPKKPTDHMYLVPEEVMSIEMLKVKGRWHFTPYDAIGLAHEIDLAQAADQKPTCSFIAGLGQ